MAITQYHFSPSQNSHISKDTHTFNMTLLRAQLPGSQRGGRLKIAMATPTGTIISSVLCFQSSPTLFSEPLYTSTNSTFVSSYNKNTTRSKNSLTVLKNSPSSNNVKFRALFNIQWNHLTPNILGCLLKTQDLSLLACYAFLQHSPEEHWLCTALG